MEKSHHFLNIKFVRIVVLLFLPVYIFAQTKVESETIPISTGQASISMQAKRNKSYLEVKIYNNNPVKTYKVNFSVKVTLRNDKGEYNDVIKTIVTIKPNSNNYAMSYGSHFANAVTREIYSSLVDAELDNFSWEEIGDANTSNASVNSNINNGQSTTTIVSSTTETRYNTNPQVKEAVERQNRLNNLQKQQQEREQAAKEFTEKNQRDYIEKQKQQQQTTQSVLAFGESIRSLINENAERKDAEEARKKAYKLRMEEEARSRKIALETKIANRKSVLEEFPAKDIPLGSKEKAVSIYYFVYAYDNTINNEYGATVYVSNVFEIGKYNDDTRAYTATVKNEISNLTPFTETLHGYYYSQQEAEKLRQSFISLLQSNSVTINNIIYKGKPMIRAKSNATTQENFWGETKKNDQNLAPAKINITKPSELPSEEQKKKNDFWD